MKKLFIIIMVALSTQVYSQEMKILHDFTARTIDGSEFDFSQLAGKKVLIVNTASKCGFTPQYEDLEKLFKEFGGDNFTIIGFPANNFANQEPATNEEIKEFCRLNYGVSFQMMEKTSVKGDDIHPIYSWLTNKSENGVMDSQVKWNFQKYMIDEEGKLVGFAAPREKPYSEKILNWIKKN